jgi:hypothetical protein
MVSRTPPLVPAAVAADGDELWPLVRDSATSFVPRRADFATTLPRLLGCGSDTVLLVAQPEGDPVIGSVLASSAMTTQRSSSGRP